MIHKWKLLQWGLIGFLSLLCACTGQKKSDNIFNYANGAEPKDLDPHIVTGIPEHHIIDGIFEPLVSVDPKTVEPRPGVAESWAISKDGKIYTFKIRTNAKWSNGEPLTAHDFVYSWQRLLDPKTAAQYAYQAYYIKNGKGINTGKIKDLSKLGAKALDDYTLEVTLEAPTPFFLGLLYHHSLMPVPRKVIEKEGGQWTKPGKHVSNGAFKLESWELNKVLKVRRNPFYWDAAVVKLDGIDYYPIESTNTEEKMFRAGKLHNTNLIPLEKIPSWQKDKTGVYNQHPYLGTYFYRANITREPLKDKRIRKALAYGFSREDICNLVTRGGELPATALTPPGAGGFESPKIFPVGNEKLEEAKKLLAEAGYPDGKGFPKLEILYNTLEQHQKIALAIAEMWRKNLGIEITLYNQEWKVYLATTRMMNYQLSRLGWIGDYNDPNSFLDLMLTDGGNNETGFSNKQYDSLIAQAANETNQGKRFELFRQAEEILGEEVPLIPIYTYTRVYLLSKNVKGWYPNIMDFHPVKYLSIE